MVERPYCCPEPRCDPLTNEGYEGPERPGCSWSCFGKMPTPLSFTYDSEVHVNSLNRCVYTPLKGLVRFQENATDWALDIFVTERALCALLGIEQDTADRWRWLKRTDLRQDEFADDAERLRLAQQRETRP